MQTALISMCYLRVLEKRVFLNAFYEHQSVGAVPGPVQQVLHQVLVILEDSLWRNKEEDNMRFALNYKLRLYEQCLETKYM